MNVPSASAPSQQPRTDYPRCGAKTKAGTACVYPAGRGTQHGGFGRCHLHSGNSPNGIKNAANIAARHLAVELDMEPHDALLWCVRIAAGEVRFFTEKISALEEDALVVQQATEKSVGLRVGEDAEDGSGEVLGLERVERTETTTAHLHIWYSSRAHAVDRLNRYAKTAVDAGVAERQVRIAETLGADIAALFEAALEAMGATTEQRQLARPVVYRHLLALEGGSAA